MSHSIAELSEVIFSSSLFLVLVVTFREDLQLISVDTTTIAHKVRDILRVRCSMGILYFCQSHDGRTRRIGTSSLGYI